MLKRILEQIKGTKGFLVSSLIIITYAFLLMNLKGIANSLEKLITLLAPFIYGFCIAYLINPIVTISEKVIGGTKIKVLQRKKRIIGMLFSYIFLLLIISLFSLLVVPQVIESIGGIVKSAPTAIEEISLKVTDFAKDNLIQYVSVEESENILLSITNSVKHIFNNTTKLFSTVLNMTKGFTNIVVNLVFGLIISIYMLLYKDNYRGQLKKILFAYMSDEKANNIITFTSEANRVFSAFISIKIIDAILIGILCYIGCRIIGVENALLISVIVGVTDIIPYFGPFIGAIPSAMIILFESPINTLFFIILIIILQQFEGNILEPKLLGDKLGLNGILIIFAVVLMSGILGIVGLFIGVPLFTLIYTICKRDMQRRLEIKGKSENTEDYL